MNPTGQLVRGGLRPNNRSRIRRDHHDSCSDHTRILTRVVTVYFYYKTPKGVVSIVQRKGRWHVIFEDADLGSYVSAHLAADDIGAGHTPRPPSGIDLSLGIPKDLEEWTYANGVTRE